jgi:hypothetical protein
MRVPATSPATSAAARTLVVGAGSAVAAGVLLEVTARGLGWGQVVLHECVPGDGPLGVLGLRVALLRASAVCPDGTFAVGPGRGVVASVALGTLLLFLALLGGGMGLTGALSRAAHSARAMLSAMLPVRPADPSRATPPARLRSVVGAAQQVASQMLLGPAHPRRGPPAFAV